jgi:hypothetical protein
MSQRVYSIIPVKLMMPSIYRTQPKVSGCLAIILITPRENPPGVMTQRQVQIMGGLGGPRKIIGINHYLIVVRILAI